VAAEVLRRPGGQEADVRTPPLVADGPPGRWLAAARAAWVKVLLLALATVVASAPLLFEQYETLCLRASGSCLDRSQLTPEGLRELERFGLSLGIYAALAVGVATVSTLVWLAVGTLVFLLRSDDRMALLVASFLVAFGTATFSSDSVDVLVAATGSVWWLLPTRGLQVLGEVLAVLFFLTFPDGRFVPRWTLLLGVVFLVFQIPGDLSLDIYSGLPYLERVQSLVFTCFLVGMIWSQVYRYRSVSRPDQRRQTKWVVFGTALALSLLLALLAPLFLLVPGAAEASPFVLFLIENVIPPIVLLIPLSVGTAMLRSGLFDIDLVINRALVYAALTSSLVLVYVGSVVSIQYGLRSVSGAAMTSVEATMASWELPLFSPLRRRIQGFIDRRFYRKKYDARKTLASFSSRLRDETDLEALTGELVGVARRTMQPAHVSVWLRGPTSREGRGRDV
jgi:hypothetical protein